MVNMETSGSAKDEDEVGCTLLSTRETQLRGVEKCCTKNNNAARYNVDKSNWKYNYIFHQLMPLQLFITIIPLQLQRALFHEYMYIHMLIVNNPRQIQNLCCFGFSSFLFPLLSQKEPTLSFVFFHSQGIAVTRKNSECNVTVY